MTGRQERFKESGHPMFRISMMQNRSDLRWAVIWQWVYLILALAALVTSSSDAAVFGFLCLSAIWGAAYWVADHV